MKPKYFKEWLKSMELGFLIGWLSIEVNIVNLVAIVSKDVLHFAVTFPKYGFVITDSTKWFYHDRSSYVKPMPNCWFYKKYLCGTMNFYVMHIVGVEAMEVPNEI